MSDVAAIIADMVRAGVDPELIGRAAAAFAQNVQIVQAVQDPVAEKRRAYDRERKAAKKLSTGIPPESAETTGTAPSLDKENTPTPPKEIKPTPLPPVVVRARDFDTFWALFPNKVGKRDAEAAFVKALHRADLSTILDGLRRYSAKTDDRPWCNPTTFLNQDRWDDQPADAPPRRQNGHGPPNGKRQNAVEAMEEIFRDKGWTNEPEFIPSDNGDAQCLPPERRDDQGTVVDLRPGTDWRHRHSH